MESISIIIVNVNSLVGYGSLVKFFFTPLLKNSGSLTQVTYFKEEAFSAI